MATLWKASMSSMSRGDNGILILSSNNQVIGSILSNCGQGFQGNTNGDCIDIELGVNRDITQGNFVVDFGDDGIEDGRSKTTPSEAT